MSNYWTFGGKNALEGVNGTTEALDDCRGGYVTHPDETNPAVLSEVNIINALQTSRRARADFTLIFPSLSAGAKARLTTLLEQNPRVSALVMDDQRFYDRVQRNGIETIPVRTCGRRGGKGYGGGA